MCRIFSFNNVPYRFNPTNSSNAWIPVTIPNPNLFQGGSHDYNFVVTNRTLYQFNQQNNSFASILTLPPFQKYEIRNNRNQLIISGSNASTTDNVTFNVVQNVLAAVVVPDAAQVLTARIFSNDTITG